MPVDDLYEVNRNLCYLLWDMVDVFRQPEPQSPKLIFPKKRDDEVRVSEQESRVLFCNLLNDTKYYFSIETPTVESYQIGGGDPLSALSDLSLYTFDEGFDKVANVEFKAHNPQKAHIKKDVEKIFKEGVTGNWFHTLKSIDSKTISSIFNKFRESFIELKDDKPSELSVLFCFCVWDKRWAIIKHFHHKDRKMDYKDYANSFFKLDCRVGTGFVNIENSHGWEVISDPQPEFLELCDEVGCIFFKEFLKLADSDKLIINWRTVGFSLGLYHKNEYIPICWGFPPHSKFKQSLVTKVGEVEKRVAGGEEIAKEFRDKLISTGFIPHTKEMKLPIDQNMKEEDTEEVKRVFNELVETIQKRTSKKTY